MKNKTIMFKMSQSINQSINQFNSMFIILIHIFIKYNYIHTLHYNFLFFKKKYVFTGKQDKNTVALRKE